MFTRRHPYLFALLVMAALGTVSMVFFSISVTALTGEPVDSDGEKVGVIELVGAIVDSKQFLEQIKEFREAESIKAIVVRIDSPGGGVGPSQEIYREIRKTAAEKKVVASMGSVAASGGYYVAAATDGIVANPGTITGSIGVIMGYTNFEALLEKIGLQPVVIKSGEFKDVGSPVREMKDNERALLTSLTQKIHRQFIDDIAAGRRLDVDRIEPIADGRIFTGQEAKDLGLVDRLGNFQDAVQWAGELGGIQGEVETIYPEEERPTFMEYLVESALKLVSQSGLTVWHHPEAKWVPTPNI